MLRLLPFLLIAAAAVGLAIYYWYYSWYEPEKLRDMLIRNMDRKPVLVSPFRRFGRRWARTASYLWFVRIATSLIILSFVILGVLALLVASGLLR